MKKLNEIIQILSFCKKELERKYKVKEIGVFGSFVRGNAKKRSDIDILVDFFETPDLFQFVELQDFLSRKLKRKVDLVLKSSLKPHISRNILDEVIYI
ncbi:MAG: nucleotidyltransferase family protein [Nitrososphaerales archaeon]